MGKSAHHHIVQENLGSKYHSKETLQHPKNQGIDGDQGTGFWFLRYS